MSTPKLRQIELASLGGGALTELFEHELARVLANIDDENTDPTTPRTLTMKVVFTPTPSRDGAICKLEVNSKLAGIRPAETIVYFNREEKDGPLLAMNADSRQIDLDYKANAPAGAKEGETTC